MWLVDFITEKNLCAEYSSANWEWILIDIKFIFYSRGYSVWCMIHSMFAQLNLPINTAQWFSLKFNKLNKYHTDQFNYCFRFIFPLNKIHFEESEIRRLICIFVCALKRIRAHTACSKIKRGMTKTELVKSEGSLLFSLWYDVQKLIFILHLGWPNHLSIARSTINKTVNISTTKANRRKMKVKFLRIIEWLSICSWF